MLEFPEGYFKEEIRNGFAISAMMKRAWAAQLEILDKIIKICEKHGLTYYAFWGTLLGTVRHKGFIPWDDDIDIAFKREEYMHFLKVAKEELPKEYCILSAYTEEEWDNSFSRVTNGHTIDVSVQRLSRYHGFPFVAGIDIYPLDYIPRDEKNENLQRTLLGLIGDMVSLIEYMEEQKKLKMRSKDIGEYEEALEEGLLTLEEYCNVPINRNKAIKNQLQQLYDQICMMYGEEDGDIITSFPNYMKHYTYCLNKEWFAQTLQRPFENIMIQIPQGYDKILQKSYRNYMVPVMQKSAHDYPFYKEQMQLLEKHVEVQANSEFQISKDVGEQQYQVPPQWREKLYYEDENGIKKRKKIVLYCNNVEQFLEYPTQTIAKIKYVQQVLKKNAGVILWWRPVQLNNVARKYVICMFPKEFEEYQQVLEGSKEQDDLICDETDELNRAIVLSDAYYGDEGLLVEWYQKTGKPIMVQDYKIVV